jgi:asparaginyl-tRNA synthetase
VNQWLTSRLTAGTSVRMTGELQASKGAGQAVEFVAREVEVLGACDPEVICERVGDRRST